MQYPKFILLNTLKSEDIWYLIIKIKFIKSLHDIYIQLYNDNLKNIIYNL